MSRLTMDDTEQPWPSQTIRERAESCAAFLRIRGFLSERAYRKVVATIKGVRPSTTTKEWDGTP